MNRKGQMPRRNFWTLFTDDLTQTRDWYVALFDYQVEFDSDWFVNLRSATHDAVELGILRQDHAIVPSEFRSPPGGGMLTVVVDDVDAVHRMAVAREERVVEPPTNLFYGQRRMLLVDPNGLLVDVSSECEPDPDWLASLQNA